MTTRDSQDFWFAPRGLFDGPGPEMSLFFDIHDEPLEWVAYYAFRTPGRQTVDGIVLSQKMDVQRHVNDIGFRLRTEFPTSILGFSGPATIVSRPIHQIVLPSETPVPHDLTLRIGRHKPIRFTLQMSRLMFGRYAVGDVTEHVSYGRGPEHGRKK